MRGLAVKTFQRAARYFLAGVFALLPVVITVAVVVWVTDFLRTFLGPGTVLGEAVRRLGLRFGTDDALAYVTGAAVVLGAVFVIGIVVESGARQWMERLLDAILQRIPLIGNIYGTSKQLVGMLGKQDKADLKGMKAVYCFFGENKTCGFLALLVSPERFRLNGRDYQIVIVPTAPVPIGGGLLFVPADMVEPTDLSVDALMSIYVSMGITAPQFLPPAPRAEEGTLGKLKNARG
jgi:uncharacterized membrane protein